MLNTFNDGNNRVNESSRLLLNILCKQHEYSGLKLCYINAQSLVNKFDEFILKFEKSVIDVICVSESWFMPALKDDQFKLNGFKLFRADRMSRGGGSAIYIRKSIQCKVLRSPSGTSNTQYLFLEIPNGINNCILGTIYMPPNTACSSLVSEILEEICHLSPNIIVFGDINMNLLNNHVSTLLQSSMNTLNLSFANFSEPTHFAPHSLPTLIDVLLLSNKNILKSYSQLSFPAFSRHDLLFAVIDIHYGNIYKPERFSYFDFRSINVRSLFNECDTLDWTPIHTSLDVNQQVDILNSILKYLFTKYVPLKTRIVKNNNCPWISNRVVESMSQRDRLFRRWKRYRCSNMFEEYKQSLNRVTSLIKQAKHSYYCAYFDSNRSSKRLWSQVRNLGISFVGVSPQDNFAQPFLQQNEDFENSFSFSCTDVVSVCESIMSIKSKSIGVDDIHPDFVKILLPWVGVHVTHIFNSMITFSIYPLAFQASTSLLLPI